MGDGSVVKNPPAMWETWVRSLGQEDPWRRKWQPTQVFLLGKSHGCRSLVGYSPWGCRVGYDWATNTQTLNWKTPMTWTQVQGSGAICPDHAALSRGDGSILWYYVPSFFSPYTPMSSLNLRFPASNGVFCQWAFKKVLPDFTGRIQCNLDLVMFNYRY